MQKRWVDYESELSDSSEDGYNVNVDPPLRPIPQVRLPAKDSTHPSTSNFRPIPQVRLPENSGESSSNDEVMDDAQMDAGMTDSEEALETATAENIVADNNTNSPVSVIAQLTLTNLLKDI